MHVAEAFFGKACIGVFRFVGMGRKGRGAYMCMDIYQGMASVEIDARHKLQYPRSVI